MGNDGTGNFNQTTTLGISDSYARTLTVADLDGDGHLDIAAGFALGNTVFSVFAGDGIGGFGPAISLLIGRAPLHVVAVDIDGDGDLDIAATGRYGIGIVRNYSARPVAVNDGAATGTIVDDDGGDTTPDAFSFRQATGLDPGSTATSNTITVSGINGGAAISIARASGQYRINSGGFTTGDGTIFNGDQVTLRAVASNDFSTRTFTTLTIGGVSARFNLTTRDAVTTPADPPRFTPVSNAVPGSVQLSNAYVVNGIEMPTSISISGDASARFCINGNACTSMVGATVNNHDSVRVQLTASAAQTTTVSAKLDVGGLTGDFNVSTGSASGSVTFAPETLSFGNVAPGSTSLVKKIAITVGSSGPVIFNGSSLTGPDAGDFAITADTCPGFIAAGQSCFVSVSFTARKPVGTAENARLSISDSLSGSPQSLPLSGTSSAQVTLVPGTSTISFGTVHDGESVVKSITMRNNQSVAVTGVTDSLASGNFSIGSDTCNGRTLGAFASCTVQIAFTPTGGGASTSRFSLGDAGPDSVGSYVYTLSGIGSPAPVTATPASLAFGNVATGATSANQSVTIRNTRPVPISLNAAQLADGGQGFRITGGTCGTTLAALTTCTVTVNFAPVLKKALSDILSVTDTTDGTTLSVSLSGKGVAPS